MRPFHMCFVVVSCISIGTYGYSEDIHSSSKNSKKSFHHQLSMMGSTSPTDIHEEHVSVMGKARSFDGVTRQAVGGGLMQKQDSAKSVSAVSRDYIAKQVPGSNPMQLISMLPGANITSRDPGGMSGGSMSMRGLDQTQIGFTLEGFPINDIGNFSVYPQEIVDSENLRTIQVAQGSADLDSPHISSTGGVVDMYLIDPQKKPGGAFDVSYGSYQYTRGFLRLDTGKIANTNLRAYVSGSYATEGIYRSATHQHKIHAETKIVDEWGDGNRVALSVIGNQLYNYLLPNVNLASWNTYGMGVRHRYINPTSSSMGSVTNTVYNSSYNPSAADNGASYYKLHQNPFTNIYISAPSTFKLSDHLTLTSTPYFWYGNGNGGSAYNTNLNQINYGQTSVTGSLAGQSGGTRMLYNPSTTTTYRPGAVTKVTLTTGANRLMLGYWFEFSRQRQQAPYTGVDNNGTPWNIWGHTPLVTLSNGALYQYRSSLTQTYVHTMFIGDTLSLLHDRLTVDAGLKYAIVKRNGSNGLPDASSAVSSKSYYEPLPTFSVRYQLTPKQQIFISGATNFRIPTNQALYDSGNYSLGKYGGYSTRANVNQQPEISISEEAGYRYTGSWIMGSATYFHYDFTNRLMSSVQCLDKFCSNTYSTSVNAGGQSSNGVDAEIGTRPIFYHLRPYISFEYVDSRMGGNLKAGSGSNIDWLPTKGKVSPETPRYQVGFNLDYDDGHLFGTYSMKYVAKQYSTYMNDQSIPGYVLMNLTMGYRFHNIGFLKQPNITLNITNLTNHSYLGNVTSIQPNATTMKGILGKTVSGTAPTYMIAAPISAIASISGGF